MKNSEFLVFGGEDEQRRKRMIFREEILFLLGRNKTEIEKTDYIWRRKIYFSEEIKIGKEK